MSFPMIWIKRRGMNPSLLTIHFGRLPRQLFSYLLTFNCIDRLHCRESDWACRLNEDNRSWDI